LRIKKRFKKEAFVCYRPRESKGIHQKCDQKDLYELGEWKTEKNPGPNRLDSEEGGTGREGSS